MSFQHLSIFHFIHGPSVLRNSLSPLQFYQSIHGFFYNTLSALLFPFPIFLIHRFLSSTAPPITPRHAASAKTFLPPHFNSRAYTKQRQTGFIHFTITWTHGLIFFDHHYYNFNSRFFFLQYQPRLYPSLYRWCLSYLVFYSLATAFPIFQATVIFIFAQVGFCVISFGSLLLLVATYILTQGLTPNNVKLVSFTSQ